MHGIVEAISDRINDEEEYFSTRQKIVLLTVVGGFGLIVYGTMWQGYYISEIAAIFLGMGLLGGFIGGMGPSRIAGAFVDGARTIIFGALIVGLSRGIVVILTQGKIIDTIVHGLASMVQGFSPAVSAVGMMFVQSILNFVIPSSTGMAATTMPILVPLGDVIGLTRQATVVAFQFGDGLTGMVAPTSASLMGYLAVAGIPFDRWFRFALPLLGIWLIIATFMTALAAIIHLGPF